MHLSCFEAIQEMPQVPLAAKDTKHLESRKAIQMIHLNRKATSVEPLVKVYQTSFCKISCLPHHDDKPKLRTQGPKCFLDCPDFVQIHVNCTLHVYEPVAVYFAICCKVNLHILVLMFPLALKGTAYL